MSESQWQQHNFEAKLIEIFESGVFDTREFHHFGQPYVSAYQLAVAFEERHPDLCVQLNKVIGKDARSEEGTDNLARYIARELSSHIKAARQQGEFYQFEAAWLSSEGLGDLHFVHENSEVSGVPNKQYGGFSLFRLNTRYRIERDLYVAALTFIREKMLGEAELNQDWIDDYLSPGEQIGDLSLNKLYEQLLGHAANTAYNRGDVLNVFGTPWATAGEHKTRWAAVKQVLFEFDATQVATTYAKPTDFFAAYQVHQPHAVLKPHSRKYCQTVMDAAQFLSQFQNGQAFYRWVCKDYQSKPDKAPKVLEKKIKGIGYALSRDFLKERGYTRYVKPDGHVLDICEWLGLVIARDEAQTTQVLTRATELGNAPSAYALDKLLFLIGSGQFYLDGHDDALKTFDRGGRQAVERKKQFVRFVLSGEYAQAAPLDAKYFSDTTTQYADADDACASLEEV